MKVMVIEVDRGKATEATAAVGVGGDLSKSRLAAWLHTGARQHTGFKLRLTKQNPRGTNQLNRRRDHLGGIYRRDTSHKHIVSRHNGTIVWVKE